VPLSSVSPELKNEDRAISSCNAFTLHTFILIHKWQQHSKSMRNWFQSISYVKRLKSHLWKQWQMCTDGLMEPICIFPGPLTSLSGEN